MTLHQTSADVQRHTQERLSIVKEQLSCFSRDWRQHEVQLSKDVNHGVMAVTVLSDRSAGLFSRHLSLSTTT